MLSRAATLAGALLSLVALVCTGCRVGGARSASDGARALDAKAAASARSELCSDIGEPACLAACPDDRSAREHTLCLLALRFANDPEAAALARSLYERTGTLLAVESRATIDGYGGASVELLPALPTGPDRRHLEWVDASLSEFASFVAALAPHARGPIRFEATPRAVRFFRTREPAYPSAYGEGGAVGYNLSGPLFTSRDDAHETLFHELFHLADERLGYWSIGALGPLFERILERCGDDHDCLGPYAPHDTVVPDGTYYPFDARTRDVREYAAELALRYYREHRARLAGSEPDVPAFKCATEENALAWSQLVEVFFGGADLTAPCEDRGDG